MLSRDRYPAALKTCNPFSFLWGRVFPLGCRGAPVSVSNTLFDATVIFTGESQPMGGFILLEKLVLAGTAGDNTTPAEPYTGQC